jgi:hypothetical protein
MKLGNIVKWGDLIGKITSMHGPARFQVEAEFKIDTKTEIGYFNTLGRPEYPNLKDPKLRLVVIKDAE